MNNRMKSALIKLLSASLLLLGGCSDSSDPAGSGGTAGSGGDCQMVETSTSAGTWDITFDYAAGDPFEITELTAAQAGCAVTMSASDSDCTLSIAGPLSSTGTWNADLNINCPQGQYVADFLGTFSGGPPYDMLTITAGSDSDGDTITGGQGEITP